VKIACLLGEEVGTESFVGVEQNSVYVVVELGGNIFAEELDLVDAIGAFSSLA